jgi:arylsulfatase A-like enzyme
MRNHLRLVLVAVVVAAGCVDSKPSPNLILVMADDLGWGDLSSYGQELVKTPNLDQLAAEGMRFTNYYAGSSVCIPSRCALMTGMHTGNCRMRGQYRYVPLTEDDSTIAEYLKQGGYSTAIVGKWALGALIHSGSPLRRGFDYFFGFIDQVNAHNYYPEEVWENEERFKLEGNIGRYRVSVSKETYVNDVFLERSLRFIEENRDNPFFLYLPLTLPHVNTELDALTGNGMEVPDVTVSLGSQFTDRELGRAQMIVEIDNMMGSILDALRNLELDQQTVVLFTSDNGGSTFDDPNNVFRVNRGLRGGKGDLYEGAIRVPLIAWAPTIVKANLVAQSPWAAWDILPTLLDLAGLEAATTDGESFANQLRTGLEQGADDRALFWELHFPAHVLQAVRRGRWKALRSGGVDGVIELYDLATDPEEDHDLASGEHELVAAFEADLRSMRTVSEEWSLNRLELEPDVETAEIVGDQRTWPELAALLPAGEPIQLHQLDKLGSSWHLTQLYYHSNGSMEELPLYELMEPGHAEEAIEINLISSLVSSIDERQAHLLFARSPIRSESSVFITDFVRRNGGELELIKVFNRFGAPVELLRLENIETLRRNLRIPLSERFSRAHLDPSMKIRSAGLNETDRVVISEQGFTQTWIKVEAPKSTYRLFVNGNALRLTIGSDTVTATIPYDLFSQDGKIELAIWDIANGKRSDSQSFEID